MGVFGYLGGGGGGRGLRGWQGSSLAWGLSWQLPAGVCVWGGCPSRCVGAEAQFSSLVLLPPLSMLSLSLLLPLSLLQLNGGITTTLAVTQALSLPPEGTFGVGLGALDGVMVGRAAYNDPWGVLGDADVAAFGAKANGAPNRRAVVQQYCQYGDAMLGR